MTKTSRNRGLAAGAALLLPVLAGPAAAQQAPADPAAAATGAAMQAIHDALEVAPADPEAPAVFSSSDILGRSFAGEDLTGATFRNLKIDGANYSRTRLTGAKFQNVVLTGVIDMTGADLTDAVIRNCEIQEPLKVLMQGAVTAGLVTKNCDLPFDYTTAGAAQTTPAPAPVAPPTAAAVAAPASAAEPAVPAGAAPASVAEPAATADPVIAAPAAPAVPAEPVVDDDAPTVPLVEAETITAAVSRVAGAIDVPVTFETDSTRATEQGRDQMDEILAAIEDEPGTYLLTGHTDADGEADYNLALSEARARAVASYLVDGGFPADRLQVKGAGETAPVASNDDEAGRAANRRVTVTRVE